MRYLLSILLYFISLTLLGQSNIDSLRKVWNNDKLPDSIRISSVNKLAWDGFLFTDPDSAFYYAQLQYDFARKRGYTKEMAVARNTQGTAFYMSGNYARAIDHYYQSLTIKEKLKDYKGIAATLNNIGMIYDDQGDHEKAIEHYTKAIESFQKISQGNDPDFQILVASYHNIGALYLNVNNYQKSLEYFNKSLRLTNEGKFLRERAYAYSNMGHIFLELKETEKSKVYFGKAYDITKSLGDENGMVSALNNFGFLYVTQQKYPEAIAYAKEALERAQKIDATVHIKDAAQSLYTSYMNLNKYELALTMHELYISSRDSIQSDKNKEEVLRQEFKYNYERQAAADSVAYAAKRQIQELKISEQQAQLDAEKIQRLSLYSIMVLLAILAFGGYRSYKRKQEANRIITKQKLEVEEQRDKIAEQHRLLEEKSQKIMEFNNNLEALVAKRTSELENSLHQIRNYQFALAHKIRAPYVSLVGLLNLIEDERFDSKENKEVLQKLDDTSKRITTVLQDIAIELNEFDTDT